jgi:hypothetical protein
MYQGTTPSIVFEIKNYDLTGATVYVTFKRDKDILTKTDVSVGYDEETSISTIVCSLTQEETLAMKRGGVLVQIRFIYENGQAFATNKASLEMNDVLYPVVIEHHETDDGGSDEGSDEGEGSEDEGGEDEGGGEGADE